MGMDGWDRTRRLDGGQGHQGQGRTDGTAILYYSNQEKGVASLQKGVASLQKGIASLQEGAKRLLSGAKRLFWMEPWTDGTWTRRLDGGQGHWGRGRTDGTVLSFYFS